MARPPFTFDRNTLGSNGSFPLRFIAGPPFAGSQLKNAGHFTAWLQEGTIRFVAAPLTLARECLAWPWTCALLRAVDGSFGSRAAVPSTLLPRRGHPRQRRRPPDVSAAALRQRATPSLPLRKQVR